MIAAAEASVAFQRDAAQMLLGGFSLETLSAKHGIDTGTAIALLDQNEVEIERIAADMTVDGGDVQVVAKKALSGALRQLAAQVESEKLSSGLLLRTIEVLNKVSGLEAKQKMQPEPGNRFCLIIRLGDKEVVIGDPPPVALYGESREVDDA